MKSIYLLTGVGLKCGLAVEFSSCFFITTQDLVNGIELLQIVQDKLVSEGIDPNYLLELNIEFISAEVLEVKGASSPFTPID